MTLYFESHVTIEPVYGERLEELQIIALKYKFRVAELLMQKRKEDTPERSKNDTFCSSRSSSYKDLYNRMIELCVALNKNHYKVWRYKIEDVVIDSKIKDSCSLLQ